MGLIAPIVGHVGDGNFHVLVLMDVDDPSGDRATEEFVARLNMRAIAHGRHLHRRAWHRPGQDRLLEHELGPGVAIMRTIKPALDPQDILNPGKILPTVKP